MDISTIVRGSVVVIKVTTSIRAHFLRWLPERLLNVPPICAGLTGRGTPADNRHSAAWAKSLRLSSTLDRSGPLNHAIKKPGGA